MPTAYLKIETDKSLAWMSKPSVDPHGMCRSLQTLFNGMNGGSISALLSVALDSDTANATGTVTAASVAAGDTVTVNGSTVTAQDLREISQVICVADTAGSLNSTWWKIYSGSNAGYYVWYNINSAGVDPAPVGLTGVPVAAATGASNATIATATKTALDAVAGTPFVTTRSTATLTITNSAIGSATDAANGTASPGFTITTPNQGAAAPSANKFSIFGTDTNVATDIVRVLNTVTALDGVTTQDSSSAVVTITAADPGEEGNLITLATSNNTRLAKSGTTLSGGSEVTYTQYGLGINP